MRERGFTSPLPRRRARIVEGGPRVAPREHGLLEPRFYFAPQRELPRRRPLECAFGSALHPARSEAPMYCAMHEPRARGLPSATRAMRFAANEG
jgi:hypothetical protein